MVDRTNDNFAVHGQPHRGKRVCCLHWQAPTRGLAVLQPIGRCSCLLLVRVDQFCSLPCVVSTHIAEHRPAKPEGRRNLRIELASQCHSDPNCSTCGTPSAVRKVHQRTAAKSANGCGFPLNEMRRLFTELVLETGRRTMLTPLGRYARSLRRP